MQLLQNLLALMEAKKDVVELTTYGKRQIPHQYWTDGVEYRGVNVYKAVYENPPAVLIRAEKQLKTHYDLDMQECYLGYSMDQDMFVLGYDGWITDEDGEDGNCAPYIFFKMDDTGSISIKEKGPDIAHTGGMWYGSAGGRDVMLAKWPDMTEIRLD